MMLAAADYAIGDNASPPPELSDYFDCQLFSALPSGAGWKNEPYRWLERVSVYSRIYNCYKFHSDSMKRLKGKERVKWNKENKDTLRTINKVEALRDGS